MEQGASRVSHSTDVGVPGSGVWGPLSRFPMFSMGTSEVRRGLSALEVVPTLKNQEATLEDKVGLKHWGYGEISIRPIAVTSDARSPTSQKGGGPSRQAELKTP